jgi:hypothetical protein
MTHFQECPGAGFKGPSVSRTGEDLGSGVPLQDGTSCFGGYTGKAQPVINAFPAFDAAHKALPRYGVLPGVPKRAECE